MSEAAAPDLTSPTTSTSADRAAGVTVGRNALYLIVAQVITTALGIAVNALVGRRLGPSEFGLLYLITVISQLPFAVVEWGQNSYIVAEVARRPRYAGELMGTALVMRVVGTLAACAVTGGAMWLLGYDARTRILAVALILAMLPLFLAQGCAMAYRGYQRMDYDASTTVLAKIFAAVAILSALLAGGRILSLIVAQGVAAAVSLVVAVWLMRRLRMPRMRATYPIARELLTGGAPLVVFTLGVMIQQYVDAIIMSKLAPTEVVGWYGAARSFGGVLVAPVLVIGAALYPRLCELSSRAPARMNLEAKAALRPLLTVGVLTSVGTYLFADVAIQLVYGKRGYAQSIPVLQAVSPSLLLLFLGMFLGTLLNASNRRSGLAIAKLVSVGSGALFSLVCIPLAQRHWGNGGIGAGLVTSGAELVMLAMTVPLLPEGFIDRRVISDVLRALAAGTVTLLAGHFVKNASIPLRFAIVLGVFAFCAALLRLVHGGDLILVRDMFRRRRGVS